MLLTEVLYAPIPTFEQADPDTFERVAGQPTLDQGLEQEPLGRLVASGLNAKQEDRQALERISATKGRRGGWPEILEGEGDPTGGGRVKASKAPRKSPFAPLPDVAFARVLGRSESKLPGEGVPSRRARPSLEFSEDPGAVDLGWAGEPSDD